MTSIIIRVTDCCNFKCVYCYAADNDKGHITEDTLKNVIKHAAQIDNHCTCIWHGGEPLIPGLPFYERVIELQEEHKNCTFRNHVQTNGSLLSLELLDFFKKHAFMVGFSLDGTEYTHNLNRPYANGHMSFDDVFHWIKEAKIRGIGGGAICVLNKITCSNIEEIYNFSKKERINFKFNPQLPGGRAAENTDLGITPNILAQTFIKLFDMWFDDPQRPHISYFEHLVKSIINLNSTSEKKSIRGYDCAFNNKCQYSFAAISTNGDIYPCTRFIGHKDFRYGNINENFDLDNLKQSPIRNLFFERHKGLPECKDCKYKALCNSGCPNASFAFYGTIFHKDPYCNGYKKLYNHIEKRLQSHQSRKDIYIIPTTENNGSIVYSPLRRLVFWVNKEGAKLMYDYLEGKDIDSNYVELHSRISELSRTLLTSPQRSSRINRDHAVVILTNRCNMACSYCYAQTARANDCMSKESLTKIIDYIALSPNRNKKRFTFIGGGEPTIEWDLIKFAVNYIYQCIPTKQIQISITTNATLLDEDKIKWLKDHNIHISVSYDILPNLQNTQRPLKSKKESSTIVYDNIRKLIENSVSISIRSTVTQLGVEHMQEMVEFIHKSFPEIKTIHLESVEDETMQNYEYYDRFAYNFFKAREKGREYNMSVQNSLSNCVQNLQMRFCPIELCFTPDGRIVACHRNASKVDKLHTFFEYGNINGNININGNKFNSIIANEEIKEDKCKSCFAQYHCAGMCASHRLLFNEELKSAYCSFTQKMILKTIEENVLN